MRSAKKLTTSFISLLLMVSLTGCQNEPTSQPASSTGYTPGTYEGVGAGMNGEVHVAVTFDKDSITAIEIKDNAETISISKPALTRLPQDIVQNQSLNVDLASGATISSNAVITAVGEAVKQAGGDAEALKSKAKPNLEIQPDEQTEADIVVVGSGLAGVSAALEAANQGKSVLLVEKMEAYGGSSAQSGGAVCYTLEDSDFTEQDYAEWLIQMGHDGENINEELVRKIASMTGDSLEFLRDQAGVDISFPVRETLAHNTVSYLVSTKKSVVLGAGGLIIEPFIEKLTAMNNVTLLNRTKAESLIVNDTGAVCGIQAVRADGSSLTVKADSVILATGGWDRNSELTEKLAPGFVNSVHLTRTGNTGDGILMAEAIGAAINEQLPACVDGFMGLPVTLTSDFILVNQQGERFVNESAVNIEVFNAIARQESGIHYYIYDANELFEFVNTTDRAALEAAAEAGTVLSADAIEELAEQIKVDPSTLRATVDRYNSFAGTQDSDFGKDMTNVQPFENGPFYAMSGVPYIMTAYGGPVVDEECHVLNQEGHIISGLYVAGELAASNWTGQDSIGHGMSLQDALSTGRIAALSASRK